MVSRGIPRLALAGLKAVSSADLTHTARLRITTVIGLASGEEIKGRPNWSRDEVAVHLKLASSEQREIAAARGIEATWVLKVSRDTVITSGQVWQVSGEDEEGAWTETVEITGDLVKHGRVTRLLAARDIELGR